MRKPIDLRSDTVTQPTEAMRDAMRNAAVGDDVYSEDPTVNELEARCAQLTGKEAGLFVPSGTMGNIAAVLSHCARGDELVVGTRNHIFAWEQGAASALGGISLYPIANAEDGTLPLDAIKSAVRDDDIHCSRTTLVCLENTQDGRVLKPAYMNSVSDFCKERGLKIHLDGARIFNAAVALGVQVSELTHYVDSVQFCFSKGLSCPVGSMLTGSTEFIKLARRNRKLLGGGMRQCGILAAACLTALDTMVERLAEDHDNARHLADLLSEISWLRIDKESVETNMVWVVLNENAPTVITAESLVKELKQRGLIVGMGDSTRIRMVTHYGITKEDVENAARIIAEVAHATAG